MKSAHTDNGADTEPRVPRSEQKYFADCNCNLIKHTWLMLACVSSQPSAAITVSNNWNALKNVCDRSMSISADTGALSSRARVLKTIETKNGTHGWRTRFSMFTSSMVIFFYCFLSAFMLLSYSCETSKICF